MEDPRFRNETIWDYVRSGAGLSHVRNSRILIKPSQATVRVSQNCRLVLEFRYNQDCELPQMCFPDLPCALLPPLLGLQPAVHPSLALHPWQVEAPDYEVLQLIATSSHASSGQEESSAPCMSFVVSVLLSGRRAGRVWQACGK